MIPILDGGAGCMRGWREGCFIFKRGDREGRREGGSREGRGKAKRVCKMRLWRGCFTPRGDRWRRLGSPLALQGRGGIACVSVEKILISAVSLKDIVYLFVHLGS